MDELLELVDSDELNWHYAAWSGGRVYGDERRLLAWIVAAISNTTRGKKSAKVYGPEDICPDLKEHLPKPTQDELKRKQKAITARMGGRA